MKKLLRRLNVVTAFLSLASTLAFALTPAEWAHQQAVEVPRPGPTKLIVPAVTYSAAAPGLRDLRLVDANGTEVPYAVQFGTWTDTAGQPPKARVLQPTIKLESAAEGLSQFSFATGTSEKLDRIELTTSAPFFLKAVHVEIRAENGDWTSVGPAFPLFRQFGVEQLTLPLDGRVAVEVRLTLDDHASPAVDWNTVRLRLRPANVEPVPAMPIEARIVRREEFAGETVFTVALPGRQIPLAEIQFAPKDALFMRRVSVYARDLRDGLPQARLIGEGVIYRVELPGSPVRSQLVVPIFSPATEEEILVHVRNSDSPPLAVESISAGMRPATLFFVAPSSGPLRLLSGNARVSAPRYDVAAFGSELRRADAQPVTADKVEPVPNHAASAAAADEVAMPEGSLAGAPFDPEGWQIRRPIEIATVGVQELELDPAALAHAAPRFNDLRIVREQNQVPYVIESTALSRSLPLAPESVPDPKRRSVSRWKLSLPQDHLRFDRLTLTSTTTLFQRHFRLYEAREENGESFQITLAEGDWGRTPEPGQPTSWTVAVSGQARGQAIWLETDNGDNAAIALTSVQALYPVTRLVFKAASTDGYVLTYGNPAATTPSYDLRLVAERLLTSTRQPATLGSEAGSPAAKPFAGIKAGYLFWGALAIVVVVLLTVVAKLLPKPPAAKL